MSGSVRVQLVELDSGRAVPITEDGVSAGGPGADIVLRGAETLLAFVDPIDEGFVITDAGLMALTVNAAPVIGQRLARLGDQISFGEATYRIESVPEAVVDSGVEVAPSMASVPGRSSVPRSLLGWLFVIIVVVGSGAAGYLVAAMLRGGR